MVYVVFRLLTTAAALLCEVAGKYKSGVIKVDSAWVYVEPTAGWLGLIFSRQA